MDLSDLAFRCFVADHKPKPENVFGPGGLARYVARLCKHGGRKVAGAFKSLEFPDCQPRYPGCRPDRVAWLALLSVAAASMREQMRAGRNRSSRSQRDAAAAGVRRMASRLSKMIEVGAVDADQVVEFIQAGEAATVALTARAVPSIVERLAVAIEAKAKALAAVSDPRFWDRTGEAEGELERYVSKNTGTSRASDVATILRATQVFWAEDVGDRSYNRHALLVRFVRRGRPKSRAKSHAVRRKTDKRVTEN